MKEIVSEINQVVQDNEGNLIITFTTEPLSKKAKMRIETELPEDMLKNMGVKHIIFNGLETIVILENGNKGISKQHTLDDYDPLEGIGMAYMYAKATGGNKNLCKKLVKEIAKEKHYSIK